MESREVFPFDPGTRASRYNVSIPVRYRPLGDIGWTQTKTINISLTGVLFETTDPLDVESPIELSFDAPVEIGGTGQAELTCLGQVVRTMNDSHFFHHPSPMVALPPLEIGGHPAGQNISAQSACRHFPP